MELCNIWTVIPAEGKGEQVVQWLIKLTDHFNTHYGKYGKCEVMTSLDGPLGRPREELVSRRRRAQYSLAVCPIGTHKRNCAARASLREVR